ncbi:MAG: hypothetical protein JWN41_1051 [Thermoleophilia bacterium]|nr:hypothetical protein [Thermoleophilia bacterium]
MFVTRFDLTQEHHVIIEGAPQPAARPITGTIPQAGDVVAHLTPDGGGSADLVLTSAPARTSRLFDGNAQRELAQATLGGLMTGSLHGPAANAVAIFEAADGRVYSGEVAIRDAAGAQAQIGPLPKANFVRTTDTLRGLASDSMSATFGDADSSRSMLTVWDA